jgi:glutamine amidotransferase
MMRISIVDYGLGNLFSVERAFSAAGATASITSDPQDLDGSDAMVLPGVGAFGEGIGNLERLGLAEEVRRLALAGKPTLGICLGMQLLMEESEELGNWHGLGLFPGRVIRFDVPRDQRTKVPQIGWNSIHPVDRESGQPWRGTLLDGVAPGDYMYFVHSYCVMPDEPTDLLADTEYAGLRFGSVLARGNVMACQFHPEKSGTAGLQIIRNFLAAVPMLTSGAGECYERSTDSSTLFPSRRCSAGTATSPTNDLVPR